MTRTPAGALTTRDVTEITMLVSRLCQALDFSRPADFAAVFVPNGSYAAVSSSASGEVERFRHTGTAELLSFAESAVHKRQGLGRHLTNNLVIDGNGEEATAVSYVLFLDIDPTTRERRFPVSGVHRDSFRRTPSGWRFTSRTVVADI